jgi:hypothetical protein
MYENEKIRPVKTILRMGRGDISRRTMEGVNTKVYKYNVPPLQQ